MKQEQTIAKINQTKWWFFEKINKLKKKKKEKRKKKKEKKTEKERGIEFLYICTT